ncbi:MAG: glycosyltransferase family 4 protein [Prevotellaceae bacterium]|nr:glycosyltransferase family 4 protein [Prevotellaceae bacterium]
MRIGFDAKKAVGNLTGIGNYSRLVINATEKRRPNDTCLLFAPEPKGGLAEGLEGRAAAACRLVLYPRRKGPLRREWWRCRGMVKDLRRLSVDLFHGLSNELPWGLRQSGIRSVVTIHDLIFLRLPHTYGWLSRLILRAKTRHACRIADRIIAVSQRTRQDIVELYHIRESKIDVVYQGCDPAFSRKVSEAELQAVREKYNLHERYLLSVGTIEERKNQLSLVRALPLMKDKECRLLLVGKRTPYQRRIERETRRLGLQGRVSILNDVPTADLPALYQGSSAFLYMSLYEGFGIPVLEALASGVPVIAATGSCLEETGGTSSLYCAPLDCLRIAELADKVLRSPELAREMSERGREHARLFSEENMLKGIEAVYSKAMADKPRK